MELPGQSKSLFHSDGSIDRKIHLASDEAEKQQHARPHLSQTFLLESCKECFQETRPERWFENLRVPRRCNLNEVLLLEEPHKLIHAPYTLQECSAADQ